MENLKKTDLRVIKTKRAIRAAFAELMSMKPIEKITVSEVASEALINRKTFYAHYDSVQQIIAEIEDEIVAALQKMLSEKSIRDVLGNPYGFFRDVIRIINKDIDVYGRLLTVNGNSNLVQKMIRMSRQHICSAYEDQAPIDRQTLDITVYFMLSGMLAVFTEWYNTGRQQSIEELSQTISCLCFGGVQGILKKQGMPCTPVPDENEYPGE